MAQPSSDTAQQAASILLETGSILFRTDPPFTLTSGKASPVYVDCRNLIGYPRARAKLMALAADLLDRACGVEAFDTVAGGETAGIPFAAFLADKLGQPMVYVRKKPKGFGRNARIEGPLGPGARTLLVEDLATDAGSKQDFVRALRDAGATCTDVFVIFHYGIFPESEATMARLGARLHALATWHDVVALAEARGYFPDSDSLASVKAFLHDPHGWQARAGA